MWRLELCERGKGKGQAMGRLESTGVQANSGSEAKTKKPEKKQTIFIQSRERGQKKNYANILKGLMWSRRVQSWTTKGERFENKAGKGKKCFNGRSGQEGKEKKKYY